MTLVYILVFVVVAEFLGLGMREHARLPLLLATSALAVYALQPALSVRGLDFWLPTATLGLTVLGWILTTPREQRTWRTNWPAAAILGGIIVGLGLTRFLGFSLPLTASRPPQMFQIFIALAILAGTAFLLGRFAKPGKVLLSIGFVFIILLFVILKVPALAEWASKVLRDWNGQSTALASPLDLRWLGFSYVAFRLLHTLRDRQSGRLPAVSLSEYVVYVIFFPALTAGPIDRIERFVGDLRRPQALTTEDVGEAGKRLILGLFKKFAIADTLALVALNATNAVQARTTGWAWLLLYAYAFQIYFDFSGYTDIAIGLGRLLGIKLPENFKTPYLKPNLTQFWNNWHMTLMQWFRAYFFNPLTRALRSSQKKFSIPIIIFITQVSTMVLIGLWHGVTWNFVLWGLWHGLGLFIQNRWSELTKARFIALPLGWQKFLNIVGILLTFHFVAIGWVFFALPSPAVSGVYLQKLITFR
ncbi:MAG: MBOAT family O-acyltransferase [Anaerolineales bacterium]|jgi:D-alanyl-lipoteichoic acid acyltransferase DltB (MBOAT superfamily)